jgi:hypothetical protein
MKIKRWPLAAGALGFPRLVNSVDDILRKKQLAAAVSDWLPPLGIAIELLSQSIVNSRTPKQASVGLATISGICIAIAAV